jgi:hypothetical protein
VSGAAIRSRLDRKESVNTTATRRGRVGLVLPEITRVGYHAWVDDSYVVVYVPGRPTRPLADVHLGHGARIARGVPTDPARSRLRGTISRVERQIGAAPTPVVRELGFSETMTVRRAAPAAREVRTRDRERARVVAPRPRAGAARLRARRIRDAADARGRWHGARPMAQRLRRDGLALCRGLLENWPFERRQGVRRIA